MTDRMKIEIKPLPFYNRYASSEDILCGVDFFVMQNGQEYHFRSESSKDSIKRFLAEIEAYLSDKLSEGTELYYPVPWIMGEEIVYPYSFLVKDVDSWIFRYKRNQCDEAFDFECDLDRNDVLSMQKQILQQFSEMDWDSLGETEIYRFDFPEKEFEWCYSAKALSNALNKLCGGKSIQKIYVSAENYADPLSTEENYVNYYLGSEILLQLEGLLVELLILAEGLFQWRVFENEEYKVVGPTLRFIEDEEDFCDIGNVYGEFTGEYTGCYIEQIIVERIDCWPWEPQNFDESKLGKPVELPKMIRIYLSNSYVLSLCGYDDDFAIQLSKK